MNRERVKPVVCGGLVVLALAGSVAAPVKAHAFELLDGSALGVLGRYLSGWLDMVHRTHEEEQPDWMTPLVTVIPDLQQEIRTDFSFTDSSHGLETYGYLLKGTEIIPTENQELIFGNPVWITHNLPRTQDSSGFGDWTFLYKYRLVSAPDDAGNYVIKLLLGTSYATGSNRNVSGNHDFFTPMIGFGKGWGAFDYQATIGPNLPDGEVGKLGTPVTWNSTFQYHLRIPTPFLYAANQVSSLWPEVETTWIVPQRSEPGRTTALPHARCDRRAVPALRARVRRAGARSSIRRDAGASL